MQAIIRASIVGMPDAQLNLVGRMISRVAPSPDSAKTAAICENEG